MYFIIETGNFVLNIVMMEVLLGVKTGMKYQYGIQT